MVERFRLNKKVIFINQYKDMPTAYSLANVVVSPSIEPEAFGRIAVEAQAMEKIIIASNIGGSNETVVDGKTGILFDSGNAKELARILNKVIDLDNEEKTLIGKEGRKNVIKKFDVEKMCQTTFTEYNKLLKK